MNINDGIMDQMNITITKTQDLHENLRQDKPQVENSLIGSKDYNMQDPWTKLMSWTIT